MARFLYHSECTECGSSDARGVYDDNSTYCFSCRKPGRISSFLAKPREEIRERGNSREMVLLDPGDISTSFSSRSVNYFLKYDIDVPTLLKHNVVYNHKRDAVVFRWLNDDGKTILYQSRGMEKKSFFTSSNHDNVLPLYYSHSCDTPAYTCVVVEDCTSAIKLASLRAHNGPTVDSMPLLGSHLPNSKLMALKRQYPTLVFWLDHDKGREAVVYAQRAKMIGMDSHIIQTELDPKEYSYDALSTLLQ